LPVPADLRGISACTMNEPLVCWSCLILVLLWGSCTQRRSWQERREQRLGGFCARLTQWYVVGGLLLFLFFCRTMYDVVRFEYVADHFLSPDMYRDHMDPDITHIGLADDEQEAKGGKELIIPSFLRWISLASPMAGLACFCVAGFQTIRYISQNRTLDERMHNEFLRIVVTGMPLVFVCMALRATIREWAVMTGSCWTQTIAQEMAGAELSVRQEKWEDLKALEIATYEQDLQVASAFQFFAVGCFAQVCSKALRSMVNNNNDNPDPLRSERDSVILRQLGVLGLHAFVVLGIAKTVLNIVIAMISSDPDNLPLIEPIQSKIIRTLDPVFLFATVLSVVNMLLLGNICEVGRTLPKANTKFNATRALLLIGQGQFSVLRAFVTTDGKSPVLHALHNFKWHGEFLFAGVTFDFGIHQVRLLHSSLLCFECLIVAIMNCIVWNDKPKDDDNAQAREVGDQGLQEALIQ